MVFDQETVVSGKNSVVFILETTVFAAETTVEETPTMVSAAQTAVEGKNTMVVAAQTAVDERKTGLGERKTTLFISDCGMFFLEAAVFIPSTGERARAMGTRIVLNVVRNTERVVETIKIGACVIETGRIGAETATYVVFHPQRIREEPVSRCATAGRRRRATASAPTIDVAPRPLHDASPMPEPLHRLVSSNTTKNVGLCEVAAGYMGQEV